MTGKNKKQFEEWYETVFRKKYSIHSKHYFKTLPFEMQIGVYLAYYESIGLIFEVRQIDGLVYIWDYSNGEPEKAIYVNCEYLDDSGYKDYCKEAFKKADEIINGKLHNTEKS